MTSCSTLGSCAIISCEFTQAIVGLAVVIVPFDRNKNLGLDLPEPVQYPLDAEVRRARGPYRSQAGRGQCGDNGFGHIGQVTRYPVTGLNPQGLQRLLQAGDFGLEFAPAQAPPDLVFTTEYQRGAVVVPAQQVLGEIEPGVRETSARLASGRRQSVHPDPVHR